MAFLSKGGATGIRAMRWAAFAAGFAISVLLFRPAWAAPIVVVGQGVTVTGTATKVGAVWQYRYTIGESSNQAANLVRLIISEHDSHAGVHHENNFLVDGGAFSRDFVVPAMFAAIAKHNYFWNDLKIAANGVITVGFDDVHGPGMATWGVQRSGAGVVFAGPKDLLPVPVPEPTTLMLLGVGLLGLGMVRRVSRSA